MSLAIPTTVNCRVDGLVNVYTCNERDAYFEFENAEQLQQAKQEVALACSITNESLAKLNFTQKGADEAGALDLIRSSLVPKGTNFSFGFSAKSIGTVGTPITSAEELIKRVANIITTGTAMKKVPIVQITLDDLTLQS